MEKCSSIFGQILQISSMQEFFEVVYDTKAAKGIQGFGVWDHFVAILFCQLGKANSLRKIRGGLASAFGKVRYLGIRKAPKRSTLAYANEHRPWQLYEKVFYQLLDRCQQAFPGKKKFRFRNKLFSLDATVIDLCASLFDWAKYRRTKGAVKLHLLLDHDGYLPVFAHITEGKTHEVKVAWTLSFPPGSLVVVDKGFTDYALFQKWTTEKVFFVIRQKDNASFKVIEERPVPMNGSILKDEIIEFQIPSSREKYPGRLRRVTAFDPEKQVPIVFLTNHFSLSPVTIAAVYKDRWQVEIFFKTLKQNLKIKTFVGTSKNALLIQIWTALIAILLLKYLRFRSSFSWSFSNLVAMLRFHLFSYRDLWGWLNEPYEPAPVPVYSAQVPLF